MEKYFVWANQIGETKNANYLFILPLTLEKKEQANIEISASGTYTLFINGKASLHGPARAARGYFRADEHTCSLCDKTTIAILVNDYGVKNYAYIAQNPFLYFKMKVGEKFYTASDLFCYHFTPRVNKAQRYSFQRGFVENYILPCDYKELFERASELLPQLETKNIAPLKRLERRISNPACTSMQAGKKTFCGQFTIAPDKAVWKDRSISQVGDNFEGFFHHELTECLTDCVSKMLFSKTENEENLSVLQAGTFAFYDFSRNVSGFIACDVHILEDDTEIYCIFDESVTKDGFVDPFRLSCATVITWTLKKGHYALQTLEPYTLQFAQFIIIKGAAEYKNISVILFETHPSNI